MEGTLKAYVARRKMNKLMVTLRLPKQLSVDEVQRKFGLSEDEIDKNFGVVEIDPEDNLYTILVDSKAASRLQKTDIEVDGPYSNPRIAPFGLPQP
jgi:hypothetical protein